MTESKNKKLLYIAIIMAFLAFALNLVFISSAKDEAEGGSVRYVIAKQHIRFGEAVTDEKTDIVRVTKKVDDYIRHRYMSEVEFNSKKGSLAQRDINRGEFIAEEAFGLKASDFDPSTLRPNERLVSIKVDEESSIGYRLHPKDRVDIYSIRKGEGVIPVLSNVEVAAVGTETYNDPASSALNYRTIGLRVTVDEAKQILDCEVRYGDRFRITLRAPRK